MFESLIKELILSLLNEFGPLFKGAYKEPYDDKVGINSDVQYQFYIVSNDASGNFTISSPDNKNGPTLFSKDYRLVIQFTDKIDENLLRMKAVKVLNNYANSIRYNEESKIIQDIETTQKPKLDIPLMMFTFNLKLPKFLNNCNENLQELSC